MQSTETTQSNWSETLTWTPASVATPTSIDDLRAVIAAAHAAGQTVRPRGSGHSWNNAVVTEGVTVDTRGLAALPHTVEWVTDPDGARYCLLTVPSGMAQGDFTQLAQQLGCPVPTQGPAPDITLSGFVANGCHGTGWDQPTIAELVYGIEIVGPTGDLMVFDETQMPDSLTDLGLTPGEMMNVVRVTQGALGVISRITFKLLAPPADAPFHVRASNQFVRTTDYLDRNDPSKLQALVEGHDYVELFWFPYNNYKSFLDPTPLGPTSDTLWVMLFDRTTDPVSATEPIINAWNDLLGWFATFGGANGALVNRVPKLLPILSNAAVGMMKAKNVFSNGVVFRPPDAFLYQRTYFRSFLDLELTIPMHGAQGFADVVKGFYMLVDRMEAWRTANPDRPYPVNLSVHARFIKNSQGVLSPCYAPAGSDQHTCYIEYLSYSPDQLTDDYGAFSQDFFSPDNGLGWKAFGGIPNWGKDLGVVPGIFEYVHGLLDQPLAGSDKTRLATFLAVRDRIDPGGAMFTNPYLNGMLTGVPVDVKPLVGAAERLFGPEDTWTATRTVALSPVDHGQLPTVAAPARRAFGDGTLELFHDPLHQGAVLVTEQGELHVLGTQYDPATHALTYTTLTPSQGLSASDLLDRVAAFH